MENGMIKLHIPAKMKERLDALVKSTQYDEQFLANRALEEFIERHEEDIKAIQKGIEAADKGEFASDKEVKAVFKKWGVQVEN